VVSLLNYFSFLQNQNSVCVLNSCQSMGDDYSSNLSQLLFYGVYGFLNLFFVLGVQSRGGFIENEDLGFLDEGSGYGNPLLLTTRQLATRLTNLELDPFFMTHNEVVGIGILESFNDLIIGGIRLAKENILPDGSVEEDGFLSHISHLMSVVSQVYVP